LWFYWNSETTFCFERFFCCFYMNRTVTVFNHRWDHYLSKVSLHGVIRHKLWKNCCFKRAKLRKWCCCLSVSAVGQDLYIKFCRPQMNIQDYLICWKHKIFCILAISKLHFQKLCNFFIMITSYQQISLQHVKITHIFFNVLLICEWFV